MRLLAQFVGMLLLIGFIGADFWWILAVAAVATLVWGAQNAFAKPLRLAATSRSRDLWLFKVNSPHAHVRRFVSTLRLGSAWVVSFRLSGEVASSRASSGCGYPTQCPRQ
jgi:hypothetical protein